MAELRISEVILTQRKQRNMTQEELAAELGVTAQAISNWERGGYPDITMLPGIANYFEITVDELIGNDKIGQEADIEKFYTLLDEGDNFEETLQVALSYYHKYPKNYDIMHSIIWFLQSRGLVSEEHLPFLRELCEKIVNECTDALCRDDAIQSMCKNGTDYEYERWAAMCPNGYANVQCEQKEERLWYRNQRDECRKEHCFVNLFRMYFIINQDGRYHGHPDKSEAHNGYLLKLMETFGENGEVPTGWLGEYIWTELRYAAGLFGQGKNEEGYAVMERVFEHTAAFDAIPNGTPLSLGCPGLFGDVYYRKGRNSTMLDPDGNTKNLCMSTVSFKDIFAIMNRTSGWEWFNGVREENRFRELTARAKELGGIKK